MIIQQIQKLLSALLDIPVRDVTETWPDTSMLCLVPSVQTLLTEEGAAFCRKTVRPHLLLEMHETLGIRLILFQAGERLLLVGPFVNEAWSDAKGASQLAAHRLSSTLLIAYKQYYCQWRILQTEAVLHSIETITGVLTQDDTPYEKITVRKTNEPLVQSKTMDEAPNYEQAVEQYDAENELIRMVQKGDLYGARIALQKETALSKSLPLPYIQNSVLLTGTHIFRTLLRKAAESGGVHPAVVDAIAQKYAQKAYSLKNASEFEELQLDMLAAFCEAVQKVRKEHYSPIIRKAADYITLHLSLPLRLEQIAECIQVSPSHLSHLFKKETGLSVSGYIAKKRCEQAAELLKTTKLSIQDISIYVGYEDNNYFVKVFRRQYQLTPSQYREEFSYQL